MKTPHLFTRFLGNPVAVLIMCAWFLHVIAGWFQGQPSIGESIVAGCFAAASARAWRRMRTHHARLHQWNDTGKAEEGQPASPFTSGISKRRRSVLIFAPPVLGLMLLLLAANGAPAEELPLLRLLSLGCIAWLAVALVRKFRKLGGGQAASAVKVETPSAVAWVTGPARSAPSRDFATSNLPDYALSVMGLRRGN